jgi:ParB-like chromosome segregation protein Spo0J
MKKPVRNINHVKDLRPDKRNPRLHPERNISQLERSLEQYGAARSIVVDEHGNVIAGNGILEAAANSPRTPATRT